MAERARGVVAVARGEAAFDLLRDAGWDDLLASSGCPDPLRRLATLEAWTELLGGRAEPLAVVCRRAGAPVAAAAFERVRRRGISIVRPLGVGGPWFDVEPPVLHPFSAADLLTGLASFRCDVLTIESVSPDSPLAGAAVGLWGESSVVDGHPTYCYDRAATSWAYRRPVKEAKMAVRYAERRGVVLGADVIADGHRIAERIEAILEFHRRVWRKSAHNQLCGSPAEWAFARWLSLRFAREEAACLVEVRADDGTLLAFDLSFVGDAGGAVAYARAFDGTCGLSSLGWLAQVTMIDHLAEHGITALHLGQGGGYKARLADPTPTSRIIVARSALGRAAFTSRALLASARERASSRA